MKRGPGRVLTLIAVAVVAYVAGALLGSVGPSNASGDAELKRVTSERDQAIRERDTALGAVANVQQREDATNQRQSDLDKERAALNARELALKPKEEAAKSSRITEDGMYLVGKDVQPGQYKTTGSDRCYWARLKGSGGSLDDIIANGSPDGQGFVTISASDKLFETKHCGVWEKVG